MELSKQYRKHTHREHILALPDTYIGSIENNTETHFVVKDEKFLETQIQNFNPGFYKLFDELLVNAHDHAIRLRQRKSAQLVKHIDIGVNDNAITIRNDGESIDVEIHPEYNIYIPQLIFGELLTSTNYDKTEKKIVGGKNGYGVKLVNIFSKRFQITIVDATRKLKYTQVFENNMSLVNPPTITKSAKEKPYVEIVWTPDYERFGWKSNSIPKGLVDVIERRVYDLAMTVGKEVSVSWNTAPVKFRNLASYVGWYLPADNTVLVEVPQMGWEIAVSDSAFDRLFNVSFVNGIWTRSGKHVDEIVNQIVAYISTYLETKRKTKVKPAIIKEHLAVFINCFVENPSFSSQTKEVLTSKVSCKLDEDFLKKIVAKLNIVENVMKVQGAKDLKENTKTDGKKQSKITGIPKLDDAIYAGTSKSHECTLILTEGDSAKATAISGLTQDQRNYFGVFPLKGKILNVKGGVKKDVEKTSEIAALKKIIGLEYGKSYTDVKALRYGRILIMTDQDYDGSHIRGLLINMFHELWHELIKIPGFITYMATPIVKTSRGKQTRSFYTQYEYEQWRLENPTGWTIKYYKGLGTSTSVEAKEYFKSLAVVNYTYSGKESDSSIELAFNKTKADDRKEWLQHYSPSDIINHDKTLLYEDFVNKDLIHFSNYNLERSIPNVVDGLKTSQRKILFAALKRNLKSEIKVSQFAGYVAENSGYHHGEISLNETIVGMAQDYVGSNNIPWFVPQGQFGTRIQGGKDSASTRYITTYLQPTSFQLLPSDDFDCLKYKDDDGFPVEPEWYAPILPMLLINGCRGIATGYSTYIPQFNPHDIKNMIVEWLETGKGLDKELSPYYNGFKGTITKNRDEYIVKGLYKLEKDTLVISELPVETWTGDFREKLEELLVEGKIKDFTDVSTDTIINIKIKLIDGFDYDKHLTSKIKLTNMHAFNSKGVIHKYDTPNDILREYVDVRYDLYEKRRANLLNKYKSRLPFHENIVRFINQQCETKPRPDLRKKTPEECERLFVDERFVRINDSFDYLLNLPISSITLKNAQRHMDDLKSLVERIRELENTTPKQLWLNDLKALKI